MASGSSGTPRRPIGCFALAGGAGVESGAHSYAVTFVTASGQSVAGPLVAVATGLVAAPAAAPLADADPTSGTGPNPGSHNYAVTFVTAIGETTAGPLLTKATALVKTPATAPAPGDPVFGGSVTAGTHGYAVSFVTPIGETTVSPIGWQGSTGYTPAPGTGPTLGAATFGGSVPVGSHDYAVSFLTSVGESTLGPTGTGATGLTTAPASAPTAGAPTAGGSVTDGSHDYAVSFVTSVGETTPSPVSSVATTGAGGVVTPPASGMSVANLGDVYNTQAAFWGVGVWLYFYVTYLNANGETTGTAAVGPVLTVPHTNGLGAQSVAVSGIPVSDDPTVTSKRIYFTGDLNGDQTSGYSVGDSAPDATTAQFGWSGTCDWGALPGTNTATINLVNTVPLTAIPTGATGVTSRKLYRRFNGSGTFKLVNTGASLSNNSTTTYTDTAANAALGADAPSTNTAYLQTIPLTAIPTGGTGVTSRNIYRWEGGVFKLLMTLADNSTTTYTDTAADASLGATAPSASTALLQTIPLTAIPLGGTGVTARNLYRRSGGAGLKLLATIANNTATTYSDTTANGSLGAAPPGANTAYLQRIALTAIPTGGPLVTSRNVYRTAAGGSQLKLLTTLANNTTTTFADTVTDASLGGNVPVTNTATANQVAFTAIPIGAAAVTQRKVYRTVAGGSQLKLLATLADNTTSTYTDSTADASLGADVPTSDTSGLTQPQGNVIAGSTSLQVANIGAFPTSGWAVIGNGEQVIRYTGISGNVLTGIPPVGPGAIAAAIAYNSTVTSPPQLTGIPASGPGSIQYPILKGDDVNIFIQVDDTAAQAALAALIGGDGIVEDYIQDRRLAEPECRARGAAQLALRGAALVTITYECRDINTRAGRTVRVNLGPPFNMSDVPFLIQRVVMTPSNTRSPLPPLYQVTASSDRFSYEDLLRIARGKD